MKRKLFLIGLVIEAILLSLLLLNFKLTPTGSSSIMAFPFEQIGNVLKTLSLSGMFGNGLAMVLYAIIILIPLLPMIIHKSDKSRKWEYIILVSIFFLLAITLYYMINPSSSKIISINLGMYPMNIVKAILGSSIWASIVCYTTLRLIQLFRNGNKEQLLDYFRKILYVLCIFFVGVIAFLFSSELIENVRNIQNITDSYMISIRFTVLALPYVMNILITFSVLTLLDKIFYKKRAELAASVQKISKICLISLALITISIVILNYLNLLLAKYLTDVMTTVNMMLYHNT